MLRAYGRFVESLRTEVRLELAGVDAPLKLLRAAAAKERGPASSRKLSVEEDRKTELVADSFR